MILGASWHQDNRNFLRTCRLEMLLRWYSWSSIMTYCHLGLLALQWPSNQKESAKWHNHLFYVAFRYFEITRPSESPASLCPRWDKCSHLPSNPKSKKDEPARAHFPPPSVEALTFCGFFGFVLAMKALAAAWPGHMYACMICTSIDIHA